MRPFFTEAAVADVVGATVSATISNSTVFCASTLPLMSCAQYLSLWVPTASGVSFAVGIVSWVLSGLPSIGARRTTPSSSSW